MMGRPVVSLGYAAKNPELLADVGLGEYDQHVESFDPQLVLQQLRELGQQVAETSQLLDRVADRRSSEVRDAFRDLLNQVSKDG